MSGGRDNKAGRKDWKRLSPHLQWGGRRQTEVLREGLATWGKFTELSKALKSALEVALCSR